MTYAEVVVYESPVRQAFHYAIPDGLPVRVGQLGEVALRTARSQGIVIALSDSSPVARTKPIHDIILSDPVVTPSQIALAQWLAAETLCTLSACLWLMIPPGLAKRGDSLYTLIDPDTESDHPIIELLREKGAQRGAQIDHTLPRSG